MKTSEYVKLYQFRTNERCHTLEELSSGNLLVILHGQECTDLSRPKLELIRPSSKVSPLLEMITAGLCFRIQWILWRLWSCRSLSIEILLNYKTLRFEVLLITLNKT